MTSSVVGPRRKLQSTSQSQTCAKTRSWSLFGGLPPIWSTTAFWIPEKPLHLRCMLSELMRCTKNYKAYSRHWSRVQFSHSVVSNSVTPWTAARQASLSITNSQSLLWLMSIKSVMPSNHLILFCPLLLPPSIFPSSKVSILWCSAFFIVQLSHPSMTTGKTIALTRQTLVGKVMSLLFNMLSKLVITFLPRSKHF